MKSMYPTFLTYLYNFWDNGFTDVANCKFLHIFQGNFILKTSLLSVGTPKWFREAFLATSVTGLTVRYVDIQIVDMWDAFGFL